MNVDANENDNDDCRVDNEKITTSKSFEYKTKIKWRMPADNNTLDRSCCSIKIFD